MLVIFADIEGRFSALVLLRYLVVSIFWFAFLLEIGFLSHFCHLNMQLPQRILPQVFVSVAEAQQVSQLPVQRPVSGNDPQLDARVKDSKGELILVSLFVNDIQTKISDVSFSELEGLPLLVISQHVIKELVRSGKYKDVVVLESHESDGLKRLIIKAAPQRTIYDVSIAGVGFIDEEQYKRRLRSKTGQLYLEQFVEEDIKILTGILRERGYPNAAIENVQVRGVANGKVNVEFNVKRGIVCRLSEVKIQGDESFFGLVTLPIELGSVCNIPLIRKNLKQEEERLRTTGFLDASIELVAANYSTDQATASLLIQMNRGQLTKIEAVDLATGLIRDDFIKDDDGISAFDLSMLSQEDLRREIWNFFLEDGYAQANVTGPNYIELKNGDRVIRFFVEKGPRIIIGQIDFGGDILPVSRSDALESMNLDPGILSQSIPYVEKRLLEFRENLQRLLFNEGYGDAVVDLPKVTISRSGGAARLVFNIQLKKIYVLSEMNILGRPEAFEVDKSGLDDIVDLDEPLSAQRISELRDNLRRQLIESGYYYAQVTDSVVLQKETDLSKRMLLILEVRSGPLVRVRNLYTEGEQYAKSERIKIVSGLEKGSLFSPGNMEKARVRILKYDLFASVAVEAFDLSALERKDTDVDVVIRTTARSGYNFALTPGYGTRNGYRFGIDFVRNEINESGLRFNANAAFSQDKEQLPIGKAPQQIGRKITLGLTEPLLRVGSWVSPFDARVLFGLEVSNLSYETRLFETYEFSLKWRPILFDLDLDFDLGFAHEWSQTISSAIEPLEAINNPSLQIHEIITRGTYDSRDNVEWPRRGYLHELETQHARFGLDSDVSYDRFNVATSLFFPFMARWSHALSFGAVRISGVVNKKQATVTAPASRRSGLTGRATVRGFPEQGRSLGPLIWLDLNKTESAQAGDCQNAVRSIGATNLIYGKYELRYRTAYFSNMLGLAWFLDSGTAFFTDSEIKTIDNRIRSNIENADTGAGECVIDQAKLYQPRDIGRPGQDSIRNYVNSVFVSSGIGLRFIIPNFASISFDWGLPVQDPANDTGLSCSTISDSEATDQAPSCIKRDRQGRLFDAIPFPGAFHFGIGATL